jgi:hypothetical protein
MKFSKVSFKSGKGWFNGIFLIFGGRESSFFPDEEIHKTPELNCFEISINLSKGRGPSKIADLAPIETDSDSHSEVIYYYY